MAVEYIRTFLSKQGYYDHVEFRPDNVLNGQQCVTVSSEIRHGKQEDSKLYSIWLDVLQHPENYPKSLHKYQLQPDLGGMMVLETLDVTFKVYMSTSTLTIEGSFAEEWFLKNFLRILENSIDDDQLQLDQSSDVGNSELMSKESLDCELANLEIGGMRDGPTYIYKLWKSLLKMWISDGNEVYILSPFLDDKRLKDIADTCYDYKYTCSFPNSITIYTRQNCNNDRQISDLKIAISKDYDTEKKVFVKNEVFDKIITTSKLFHGKFIASIKDDISNVLLTSANFHRSHFEYSNMDTVLHLRMTKDQFLENYINPIK